MGGFANHYTGATNESLVTSYLLYQGFDVFVPVMHSTRADLVYLNQGKPVKVQVKTSSKSKAGTGGFSYEQCRLVGDRRGGGDGHAYTVEEIDEVWVVGTHLWCFPMSAIAGKTSLFLNSDNPQPKTVRRDYDPQAFVKVWGQWDRPFRDRLSFQDPQDIRTFGQNF